MESVCISETLVWPEEGKNCEPSNFSVGAGLRNFLRNTDIRKDEIILVL
jgi:hypothetical protein